MTVFDLRPVSWPAIAVAALALGGCGLKLDAARQAPTPQGTFEGALHDAYLELSQSEYGEGDHFDSDAFANRALTLSRGEGVAPEEIAARALPDDSVADLTEARGRLAAALDGPARTVAPRAVARAQAMFDCWMQEQEENFQSDDISRCRGGFESAMAEAEAMAAPPPPPPPPPAPEPPAPRAYELFFDFDSAVLTEAARAVIGAILDDWADKPDTLSVAGHADRSGSDSYNLGLSNRRAASVGDALVEGGVEPERLKVTGRGEADPVVSTPDGMREPLNRRVTIDVEAVDAE